MRPHACAQQVPRGDADADALPACPEPCVQLQRGLHAPPGAVLVGVAWQPKHAYAHEPFLVAPELQQSSGVMNCELL